MASQRTRQDFADQLRAAGLRVTPQRRAIWGAFHQGSSGHLTAEEVGARARHELPELARATIYKVLAELVRVGLLQMVEGPGAVHYDRNPDPEHQHFRCRRCERLYDVRPLGLAELGLPEGAGFRIERRTVVFEGVCPACAG